MLCLGLSTYSLAATASPAADRKIRPTQASGVAMRQLARFIAHSYHNYPLPIGLAVLLAATEQVPRCSDYDHFQIVAALPRRQSTQPLPIHDCSQTRLTFLIHQSHLQWGLIFSRLRYPVPGKWAPVIRRTAKTITVYSIRQGFSPRVDLFFT